MVWRPPGGTSVFVYLEVFVAGGRKEEGGREGEMGQGQDVPPTPLRAFFMLSVILAVV